jgi:hypothetical protein
MHRIMLALFSITLLASPLHAEQSDALPILVIGASYESGKTPINDALAAPFGGIAVNFGNYLSLGDALIRTELHNGLVINEAEGGATTFDRAACLGDACLPISWQGYEKQLRKALMRVAVPDPANPQQPLAHNARYLVIGNGNDCLHADAFGIPQGQTRPCTTADVHVYIDRLVAVGRQALALGITPVYTIYPHYADLDLPLAKQLYGISWIMDEQSFTTMRDLHRHRIASELPTAILVDAWKQFAHLGDGLHPTPQTASHAARRIARAIYQHGQGK